MSTRRELSFTNRTGAGFLKTADEMEISRLAAARMRTRKLLKQLEHLEELKEIAFMSEDDWLLNELYSLELKHLDEIFYLFNHLDKPAEKIYNGNNKITDYDIEQAKNFPIDHVILFVNNKAYAWCHDDRTPSLMHWKKENLARCFVCNKTFNPIDVLVQRDGLSFVQAVKRLI